MRSEQEARKEDFTENETGNLAWNLGMSLCHPIRFSN